MCRRGRDAWIDWVWAWAIDDAGDGTVRVLLRTRGAVGPRWLATVYGGALWTDFIMGRSHLRGLKQRVEAAAVMTAGIPHGASHR